MTVDDQLPLLIRRVAYSKHKLPGVVSMRFFTDPVVQGTVAVVSTMTAAVSVLTCTLVLMSATLFGLIVAMLVSLMATIAIAGSIIGFSVFCGASLLSLAAGSVAATSITGAAFSCWSLVCQDTDNASKHSV
jgi:hypothetical protein